MNGRKPMRNNPVETDIKQINSVRSKTDVYAQKIVREQEQVIDAATKGIKRINADLKALEGRLKRQMSGPYTAEYYELKDRYINKLGERETLEFAITTAKNSISASKLHAIPGEFNRAEY